MQPLLRRLLHAWPGRTLAGRDERRDSVINRQEQTGDLGVSVMVIAGGEPYVRKEEIFRIANAHPAILFPVFSNGLLIDERMADAIVGCREHRPGS